jgi:putative phage-type endonuclease
MSLLFHYHKDLPKPLELKANYLKQKVLYLKNIFQPAQKSQEWYDMRHGMVTASDWGTILGENHYSNINEVLKKKCGDDSNGFFCNPAMQWGNKYEDVAVLIYKHRNNVEVWDFGCLQHPQYSFLGASPDGITPEGVMLEIKCPSSRKITGIPPPYYWCQVQGQLEVCDLDRCDFLECCIKEYQFEDGKTSEEFYLEDHYEDDYSLCKYGNEKGVIAEFYKKSDQKFFFVYSPVNIIGEELQLWKNKIIDEYDDRENVILSCFYYWYLLEVSCVPIYRNMEWFHDAKVKLRDFWDKVLKYRVLGVQKLLEDIQMEKNKDKGNTNVNPNIGKKQRKMKDFIILDGDGSGCGDGKKENVGKTVKRENKKMDIDDDEDDFVFQTNTSLFSD